MRKIIFTLLLASSTNVLADVVIMRCALSGSDIKATAGSESVGVRNVDTGKSCAKELEIYILDGLKLRDTGYTTGGDIVYTLIR